MTVDTVIPDLLMDVHKVGLDDGYSGMSSRDALRKRVGYKTAFEREIYSRAYESGVFMRFVLSYPMRPPLRPPEDQF